MNALNTKIMIVVALGLGTLLSTQLAAQDQPANFHHVRLNVTNPQASIEYYQKFFSAVPVKFRGVSDAILTDRSYFLFNKVDEAPPKNATTALWHVGWGGMHGPSEQQWRTERGITWDTDITTVGIPDELGGGHVHFMYAEGPDKEIIEIWTGTPTQRYNHVHLLTNDVNATRDWYMDNLGATGNKTQMPRPGPAPEGMTFENPACWNYVWQAELHLDGVVFNIFGMPDGPTFWWPAEPIEEFEQTEGHALDHLAFSYPAIQPVLERMKANGVEIVQEIAWNEDLKMKSFFVRAPDNVLIEIVEADPLPHASWMDHIHPEQPVEDF
ncbi:MAG: VOC family protein [Pirellulaceae bacterium]